MNHPLDVDPLPLMRLEHQKKILRMRLDTVRESLRDLERQEVNLVQEMGKVEGDICSLMPVPYEPT